MEELVDLLTRRFLFCGGVVVLPRSAGLVAAARESFKSWVDFRRFFCLSSFCFSFFGSPRFAGLVAAARGGGYPRWGGLFLFTRPVQRSPA